MVFTVLSPEIRSQIRFLLKSAFAPALALWLVGCSAEPLGPELSTPQLAVEFATASKGGKIYFTPEAQASLPGDPGKRAQEAEAYQAVLHDPKAWRALYRTERFDTLLLTGDPASFRPLLDHLRVSRDWTLTYLDATSLIYQRSTGAKAWGMADLESLKTRFASRPKREQLLMRVQVVHRLTAIHQLEEAKALLDETLKLNDKFTPALTELASWHALQGQWEAALEAASRAVKYDKNYLPAVAAEGNALFAHGRFSEALQRTRQLITAQPDDGSALYLHAKVTHAARAFQEEIEALTKIIAQAEARKMPTGTWRVYLGQAYGATGDGEKSIEQLELALKDSTLSEAERKFASKAIERIKNREPIL